MGARRPESSGALLACPGLPSAGPPAAAPCSTHVAPLGLGCPALPAARCLGRGRPAWVPGCGRLTAAGPPRGQPGLAAAPVCVWGGSSVTTGLAWLGGGRRHCRPCMSGACRVSAALQLPGVVTIAPAWARNRSELVRTVALQCWRRHSGGWEVDPPAPKHAAHAMARLISHTESAQPWGHGGECHSATGGPRPLCNLFAADLAALCPGWPYAPSPHTLKTGGALNMASILSTTQE